VARGDAASFRVMDWLRHYCTRLGTLVAHPTAFFIVWAYGVLWILFERETFNWHAVATMATWMMTLFIQRSEHRDTQAIHAKLDELLRSDPHAKTELAQLDDEEPEEIEAMRRHRAKRERD
jgi:low affinity Fe/Cu permease